jgi:mono/diheme cytochrome c family protein
MKKIIQYIVMLTVSLMATSCYYDELQPEAAIVIPDTVSYATDIQPLWDQSCISCHKAGATAPDLTAANSYLALTKNSKYVTVGNAATSSLHKSLLGDGAAVMPTSGKWSDSKIALVDKWINDGALNN